MVRPAHRDSKSQKVACVVSLQLKIVFGARYPLTLRRHQLQPIQVRMRIRSLRKKKVKHQVDFQEPAFYEDHEYE